MRKWLDGAMIATLVLAGAWTLGGCEQQDQLLSTIPGSITNPSTPRTAIGGIGGPGTVAMPTAPAPGTFLLASGRTILVACPPTQPDLDCSDFATQDESRRYLAALVAAGFTPSSTCHDLDRDGDGVCNSLPLP